MGELQRIRGFLDDVRRRLLLREALLWAAVGGATLSTLLLALALSAARFGPGSFWRPVTLVAIGACLGTAGLLGVWRPRRKVRTARQTARLVARLHPRLDALSGDIISAMQLEDVSASAAGASPATPSGSPWRFSASSPAADPFSSVPSTAPAAAAGRSAIAPRLSPTLALAPFTSPALARAFQGTVAEALRPLTAASLVTLRPAARGGVGLLAALALLIGWSMAAPSLVGRGLSLLFHRPSLFEGSLVSAVPIVGDVRITYEYPPYTGLPVRIVEGSTGDIVAVRGSRVKIETTPLRTSRKAALLMGEAGDGPEVPVRLAKGTMTVHLSLQESGNYRFWLQPLLGRALREERSHRIEVETDRAPRIEIQGPADRLELASPRPIEIGYSASDDYGLGAVDLIFRIDDAPERRMPLKDAHGAKTAQGRLLWDPSHDTTLPMGARVAYHIEARDLDQVSGAKIGTSRTLYVTIARPQESADERLDRQREILEHLTGDLADRLEIDARSAAGGAPSASRPSPLAAAPLFAASGMTALAVLDARVAGYRAVHEAEEAHITLLGRLLDDDRRQGILGKALRAQLAAIAERLGRLLRDERTVLAKATAPASAGARPRAPAAGRARRLAAAVAAVVRQQPAQVAELERDVLLIDDLIGRQRLEDLASVGRELTDAHKRLEDLLSRYAATKDEALKRQLEREVRELRARIADLGQKIASLKSRNEVSEEWRNLPDMKEVAERAKKLDELLAQGDPSAIAKALSELGQDLRGLRQMLDDNAEGFGEGRFPQENRVISELMKRIGDLEGDERSLAGETQGLSDKQEAEMEKRLHGQLTDWTRKEGEKVERLRAALGEVRGGDAESPVTEEIERARESAKQLKRLLAERDLADAKGEAQRATQSLDRAAGDAADEAAAAARRKKKPAPAKGESETADGIARARAMAQEIADDVEKFMPKPEETLGAGERERARAQAERQSAIGDRADDTAHEAGRQLGKIPGLEQAQEDLRAATEQMRQAANHLRKSEAKQAGGAERSAAERLAKLRDSLQERSMGGGKQQRDPVRIPGADESSAPRAWRQELLDAMKEHAPEHFRDDVRRYYEELVK